jgi:hypothetical protein
VRRLAAIGVASAVLLPGCGGGGSRSTSSSAASASTTHATPTIAQPGAQPGSLATIKQQLSAAGYSPKSSEVSGNAAQSLEVDGVSIYSYRTEAAAVAEYKAIRKVYSEYPGRGVARLVETHLYSFGEERPLTSTDRARFSKIVSIAEAGK